MKLFQSVLLLLALEVQKKSSCEGITSAVVSVYSCDFIKYPLNTLQMMEDVTAGHHVMEEPVMFLWGKCS